MKDLVRIMFNDNYKEISEKNNKLNNNEHKLFEIIINTLKEYMLDFVGGNEVMDEYFKKLNENCKEQLKEHKIAKSTENRMNNKNKIQLESSDEETEGVTRFRKINKTNKNVQNSIESIKEFSSTIEDNSEEEDSNNSEEDITIKEKDIESTEDIKIHTDNENEIIDEDIEVPPSIPPKESSQN